MWPKRKPTSETTPESLALQAEEGKRKYQQKQAEEAARHRVEAKKDALRRMAELPRRLEDAANRGNSSFRVVEERTYTGWLLRDEEYSKLAIQWAEAKGIKYELRNNPKELWFYW